MCFLACASSSALAFPAWAAAGERKLRHACIGVGGMGDVDLQNFLQHPRVDVVALCDVDANHLQAAAAKAPNARKYQDWRELLDQERTASTR